jgi:hypothetical protein
VINTDEDSDDEDDDDDEYDDIMLLLANAKKKVQESEDNAKVESISAEITKLLQSRSSRRQRKEVDLDANTITNTFRNRGEYHAKEKALLLKEHQPSELSHLNYKRNALHELVDTLDVLVNGSLYIAR